jgi:cytochrome P450
MIFADRFTFDHSSINLPNFDLICPHGLAVLGGDKWKRHIRVLQPMFKRANMVGHLETIVRYADHFIDRNLHPDQIHRKLLASCQLLTMNILGFIGFGYDLDLDVDSPIRIAFNNFNFYASLLTTIPWVPRCLARIYFKCNWKYQRNYRLICELIEKVVEQEEEKQNVIENQRPENFIASLVSSLNEKANDAHVSSGLTRSEIFDEVFMSIVNGYDATAAAIAWFIFYVSKNPEVQQRIKDELHEQNLLMNDDVECAPPLTQDNLNSLIYCECVMKEVHCSSEYPLGFLRFLYL